MTTHRFVIEVDVPDDHENAQDAEWWADAATGALDEYGCNEVTFFLVDHDPLDDKAALDRLAYLLAAPEWPGASGMEDVAEIVQATGRDLTTDETHDWPSH